jgi:hypothetical protein
MKTSLIATALVVALTGAANAQPSQGQGGANTSPTSNSANSSSHSPNNMDRSATIGTTSGNSASGGNSLSPGSGMTGSPHPSSQSNVGGSPSGTTR